MTKKNILAVIPARGGSKGLPWKNIMLLNGKPLIYYMITAAKACRFIDKLLLSTDDERIAGIGKEYGIDVPFTRPAELAQDDTPIIPVLKHAMDYLDSSGWKADLVLSLQPTNPLTTADIIGSVIKKHLETDCDSVVTVTIIKHGHPYRAKRIVEGDRLVNFVTEVDGDKFICRQERPPAYAYNGAVYSRKRELIEKWNGRDIGLGTDVRCIEVEPELSVNIDDAFDFKIAELLLNNRKE